MTITSSVADWERMVDRNFYERSATIIQNDYPVNARYLLKKILDQARSLDWGVFYLMSTRLCYDDAENAEKQAGDRLVYDYPPLIDACRRFIENRGSIRVLTWRTPEVNNFSRALVELHDHRGYGDSIEITSMNKHKEDSRPAYWLDCATSGTSYRVEVPESESQDVRSPQNTEVDVRAIACANDDRGYIDLLRKRFEYFSKDAEDALPNLRERVAQ